MAYGEAAPGHAPVVPLPPGARPWDEGLALVARDGVRLRGALWNPGGARGLALYFSGRTEYLEKTALGVTALTERGYAVASLDWRGQGLSERLTDDPMRGHVGSFAEFEDDLATLMAAPEVAAAGPVRLALGHSMGAAILLGAIERGMLHPDAVALSAPMAGIAIPGLRGGLFRLLARAARGLGLSKRWAPIPDAAEPYVFKPFEGNCLTTDAGLYAWCGEALRADPRLGLGLPSFGWMAAAYEAIERIGRMSALPCPAAVILGTREGVVDVPAAKALAARTGAALTMIEGALHDLPIEAPEKRAEIWRAVDRLTGSA